MGVVSARMDDNKHLDDSENEHHDGVDITLDTTHKHSRLTTLLHTPLTPLPTLKSP